MNDYTLFQFSITKGLDIQRERTRDRLAALARCCQPSRIVRWLMAVRESRRAKACASPSCA